MGGGTGGEERSFHVLLCLALGVYVLYVCAVCVCSMCVQYAVHSNPPSSYSSVSVSVSPSVCPSVCPSVRLYVYTSIRLSVYPSVCLCKIYRLMSKKSMATEGETGGDALPKVTNGITLNTEEADGAAGGAKKKGCC